MARHFEPRRRRGRPKGYSASNRLKPHWTHRTGLFHRRPRRSGTKKPTCPQESGLQRFNFPLTVDGLSSQRSVLARRYQTGGPSEMGSGIWRVGGLTSDPALRRRSCTFARRLDIAPPFVSTREAGWRISGYWILPLIRTNSDQPSLIFVPVGRRRQVDRARFTSDRDTHPAGYLVLGRFYPRGLSFCIKNI